MGDVLWPEEVNDTCGKTVDRGVAVFNTAEMGIQCLLYKEF
jgi:hypothetical protein